MKSLARLTMLVFGIGLSSLHAEDWPQWRGPHRTGVVESNQLPDPWPAAPPSPRWRVFVGEGHSSPVIAGGRVFIMGREHDDIETCLCFDARTGERLWRHAYVTPYKAHESCGSSGPNATPTVDRDRVYMFGLGGMLNCLETKTGRVIWSHNCATEYWSPDKDATGDNPSFPPCGASASGVVSGDLYIVPVGDKKAGAITAFDRHSGQIVWRGLSERSSYGSPIVAELGGKRQVVGFTGLRMVGLAVDSGELLWEHKFEAYMQQTILTPVIWNDLVIFGGEKKPTIALRISRSDREISTDVVWHCPGLRSYLTSSVVIGDHLVGFNHSRKELACVEISTGSVAWTSPQIGEHVSLVVAGQKLLALNSNNELYAIEATPRKFEQLAIWKFGDTGGTRAHLALSEKCLYVKDTMDLLCFELASPKSP